MGPVAHRRVNAKLGAGESGQATVAHWPNAMSDIHDIVDVEVFGKHRLRLTFDDGAIREVDLEGKLDGPVFEPLRDPALFARAMIDPELGTVTWPTGADLDPIVVYEGLPPLHARVVPGTPA
jgi:Protein of unknown function (DUF2442)